MELSKKYFEGLPTDLRFWNCNYKEALGDPYINPLPIDEVLKKKGTGVALVLGSYSNGILAVDFDGTKSDLTFQANLGVSVAKLSKTISCSSGRKNRVEKFYRVPREWWDKVTYLDLTLEGCGDVELRWGKHYSLIGGKHPRDKREVLDDLGNVLKAESKKKLPLGTGDGTGKYEWIKGLSPAEVSIAEAPLWFLQKWEKLSKKKLEEERQKEENKRIFNIRRSKEELIYDSSRVFPYLERYLSPANEFSDYNTWLKIIMSLHSLSLEWEEFGVKDKHRQDAHIWSSWMNNYDSQELDDKWDSFTDKGISIATFFHKCKESPNWEIDHPTKILQGDDKEKPKRKRSELLKDLISYAKKGKEGEDDFFETYAEYEHRFKRRQQLINNDLLHELRNEYAGRSFRVGEVNMELVEDLSFKLEGFLVNKEVHHFWAGAGMGKTSLLGGMIKAGYKGVGFLNQVRHREPFRTLWIACDGGSSRVKSVYKDLGLTPEMVDIIGADTKQGLTSWKWTIPNLVYLIERLKNKEKNYGFLVFDSLKGMLANTGYDYTSNEHADSICQFLREIIAEPFGVAPALINHLGSNEKAGSGAKRWGEAVAVNVEIKSVMNGAEENHQQRKLCIWKCPINGRSFIDYKLEDGLFKPVNASEMAKDCYGVMKKYVQEVNFKTGQSLFKRKELQEGISNYSRSQIDKAKDEHLKKGGIFKPQKDSNGEKIDGRFILKNEFKLNKQEEGEEEKIINYDEHLAYWDADPETLPKHLKKLNHKEIIGIMMDDIENNNSPNKQASKKLIDVEHKKLKD